MALQYGLNNAVDFASSKIMMFASVYSRTMGQPMDKTQLWYPLDGKTALARAQEYAASDSAYVGQELAIVDVEYEEDGKTVKNTTAKIYVIQDAAGNLQELGQASGINTRLDKLEAFFEVAEGEKLDQAFDTLIEIQKYIDEHGDVFIELRADADAIYDPWKRNPDGSYQRDENGNRILAEKAVGILQDEIDRAKEAERKLGEDLTKEAERALAAERAIYDSEGGTDAEGNKVPTGKLQDEIIRAIAAETKLREDLDKETEARTKADKAVNDHIASLFKTEGEGENKTYSGEIVDYIVDAVPIATLERLGRVKSSEDENYVMVHNDGTMEVNSLNVMKLTQTEGDLLILDGGNANGITPKVTT